MTEKQIATIHAAHSYFEYRLAAMLVGKGSLTKQEAASVFIEAANDCRTATEENRDPDNGEAAARTYETMADWILR